MFTLRLLGGLILEGPSGPASGRAAQRRRLALLALLGVAGDKGLSRDKLASYLWPESDAASARHLLSDSIYVLRKALSAELLVASGEFLRLDAGVVWSDVSAFERLLEEKRFEEALNLYAGPFLDGFYLGGEGEFDGWVEGERQRLADEYARALESAAEEAETAGDPKRAVEWWKKLVAHDPYNSRAMLRLMEALAAAGDPANALELLRVHELRLQDELGLELPEELQAFADRHRREPVAEGTDTTERPHTLQALAPLVQVTSVPEMRTPLEASAGWRWLTWRRSLVGGLLAFGVLGVATVGYMAVRTLGIDPAGTLVAKGVLEERDRIVLADFENHTADSTLNLTVTEAFRVDFQQYRTVSLVPPDHIRRVLTMMRRDPAAPFNYEAAQEVAVREGLKAVIAGQVNSAGAGYMLSAKLIATQSGEVLVAVRETAADSTELIRAIDDLSKAVRARIGESLKSIRTSKPLHQVTTNSLEALRKYSQGVRARESLGDRERGRILLEEAVALDTTFAMAYRKLATYARSGSEWRGALEKAYEYSDGLPDRERYLILGSYYQNRGRRQEAIDAYLSLLEIYPNDDVALNNVALEYMDLKQFARAESMFVRALELAPWHAGYCRNTVGVQTALGKTDEAAQTLERCFTAAPGHPRLLLAGAELESARGNYSAAESLLVERRDQRPGDIIRQASTSQNLGRLAQVQGRLREAEGHTRDAMKVYDQNESAALYLAITIELASCYLFVLSDTAKALESVAAAIDRYPVDTLEPLDRPYLHLAAFYAFAGRPDRARDYLVERENLFLDTDPSSSGIRLYYGIAALAEGRAEEALSEYRVAERNDVDPCTSCYLPLFGHAYELAGQPDSAVAMYERYVGTGFLLRLLAGGTPAAGRDHFWLPVAYQRLGDLFEQRGDTAKAVYYYGKFVGLWKDADPELQPRVEAARRAMEALAPGM